VLLPAYAALVAAAARYGRGGTDAILKDGAMLQAEIFDRHRDQLVGMQRTSDPDTSYLAAEFMASSGKLRADRALALEAVRRHPHYTASELEHAMGVRDGKIRKRLAELAKEELAVASGRRICGVTGRDCQTWESVE